MKRGKLIVIEGNDGSGKATQSVLLHEVLIKQKIPVKIIDFPRYNESFFGKFIARFLQGEFGKLEEINPYILSIVYADDRREARDEIENWLLKGYLVLANRYVSSNLAHQSGRMPKNKKDAFIQWDLELEYDINKLPKEDLTVYLHVPYKVSQKLLATKTVKKDMVEKDAAYLKNSEKSYDDMLQRFSHWEQIECVDKKGNMRSKEEIHEDIKKLLAKKGMIS